MVSTLRARIEQLAAVETDPRRTAAAFAIGVFLSFSPFLGLQILLGIGAALALRLSRVAVLIGLCANLPWIMLPWYALTTASAAALLGGPSGLDIRAGLGELLDVPLYHPAFWGRTGELVSAFVWPFIVGPTCGALVVGTGTYVAAFRYLSRRQERRKAAESASSTGSPGDAQERAADRHVHDAQRPRLQP